MSSSPPFDLQPSPRPFTTLKTFHSSLPQHGSLILYPPTRLVTSPESRSSLLLFSLVSLPSLRLALCAALSFEGNRASFPILSLLASLGSLRVKSDFGRSLPFLVKREAKEGRERRAFSNQRTEGTKGFFLPSPTGFVFGQPVPTPTSVDSSRDR